MHHLHPECLDSRFLGPTWTSLIMLSKSSALKFDILQAAAADRLPCSWKLRDLLHGPILEGRTTWQTGDPQDFRTAPPRWPCWGREELVRRQV